MKISIIALACLASASAFAQQQTTVKVGALFSQPNSSSSDISGPFTPSGLSLDVKSQSSLYFSIARSLTDNWGVELAAGLPPTHDVAVKVNNATLPPSTQAMAGSIVAKARQVGPSVFANYTFGQRNDLFRPFVGLGVNFSYFDKVDSTTAGNALNGGATSITQKEASGLALQAGFGYRVSGPWSLNFGIGTTQLKTKMTSNTLGIVRTADITLRPVVTTLSVGYAF